MLIRINLGAGTDIREGWINHDIAALPGIAVVHDLNCRPWPWADASVDEINASDVIEHLDDFMVTMEEIWRILKPGGECHLRVPYWNSCSFPADPTHKRGFHEITFQFFDPVSVYCQSRPYYSHARFNIIEEKFVLSPFSPYVSIPGVGEFEVGGRWPKKIVGLIGNHFVSNLIQGLRLVLRKAGQHET